MYMYVGDINSGLLLNDNIYSSMMSSMEMYIGLCHTDTRDTVAILKLHLFEAYILSFHVKRVPLTV